MKPQTDPLDMVRKSRIQMSHDVNNDPLRLIAALRKQEAKYTYQIEKYETRYAKVAEEPAKHGKT